MNDPREQIQPGDFDLSPEDQRLFDALMESGFDRRVLDGWPEKDARRGEAILSVFGLLEDYPVEDTEDTLIHATLARIDRYEDEHADRMSFEREVIESEVRRGRRLRMPDFISVAAVILIGVSVCWPLLSSMRQRAIDTMCANNLRLLGYAFGQYSNDHSGTLPVAMAGPMGSWETVRNALNLAPLIDQGYCEAGHLDCPGNHNHSKPSYSYRWFVPGSHIGWETGTITVVLGDRNPVIDAASEGRFIPPLSISINHGGRGQNVLSNDGATIWLVQPVVGKGDNIWLPNGAQSLRPGIQPTDSSDVFLAH